jgi:hypothetical protein
MTRRQRNELVAVRADLILADEPAAEEYKLHFEGQLRRGKVRRFLYASYVLYARASAVLAGLDTREIR